MLAPSDAITALLNWGTELLRRFVKRNILIYDDPAVAFGLATLLKDQE